MIAIAAVIHLCFLIICSRLLSLSELGLSEPWVIQFGGMTIVAIIAPQTSISHVAEVFSSRCVGEAERDAMAAPMRIEQRCSSVVTLPKPNRGGSLKNRRSRNGFKKKQNIAKIPETHSRHGFWRFIWLIFPEKKVRKHEKNAWNPPADFI